MFILEMCHLLNYSFCFYFAIEPTFVLELRASYTVFVLFTPGQPRGWDFIPPNPRGRTLWTGVASII